MFLIRCYELVCCLLSLCSLQLLGQSGNYLVQVAYDTVVSHIEDRCGLILVDGNNEIRLFHTCYMLNSTGDTDCKVNLRTNGLTGLSTCRSLGFQPLSTTAREQDTVPPRTSARSSRILKFSALPTPRPPDTRILASMISTVSDTALTTSLMVTYLLFRSKSGIVLFDYAFAPAIGAIFCITPGRTVAI